MNHFNLNDALLSLYPSMETWREFETHTATDLLVAFQQLNHAGVSPEQMQWLVKCRLTAFEERHVSLVLATARAVSSGRLPVATLLKALRDRELWAAMHGTTTTFVADPIPDEGEIARKLDIPPVRSVAPQLTG